MPTVFASVAHYSSKPASASRLARAEEYAKDLRLRRVPVKPMTRYAYDVLNWTTIGRAQDIDWYDERWDQRYFTYQPLRDAALDAFVAQHRRNRKHIHLIDGWSVEAPGRMAVGVGDEGSPLVGVAILTREVTVDLGKRRGLEVTYDLSLDRIYVAPKARGDFFGWSLVDYIARQAFLDLDHLARQMRRDAQTATLGSQLSGEPNDGSEPLFSHLLDHLSHTYPGSEPVEPNASYRGYTGCSDNVDW